MSIPAAPRSWQAVQAEVLARIQSQRWRPGDLIPNEAELAAEFGCARATVNRALQALADSGLLERRRRAGTRVAMHPIRKATLEIPVIRFEIEGKGHAYRYALLYSGYEVPPQAIRARMHLDHAASLLHLSGVHLADGRAYVVENRWIDPAVVPEVCDQDFSRQSPNEWLVENVPFNRGDITFSAVAASGSDAEVLGCTTGEALFMIDRLTWKAERAITSVRLVYAPGYGMHARI